MEKKARKSTIKSAGRMCLLFAALLLLMTACGPDPFYVPVLTINDVPETGEAGTPLALKGKVSPVFASNKSIIWLVEDAGTTGAVINGNILNTTACGTVLIQARVANGTAEGKDYTQDFEIYITEKGELPVIPDVYYDVIFESNGGSEIPSQTVGEGGKINKPTDPYKSGYNFGGWYRESALITEWDFAADTVTADITLYAKWIAEYTVTFNSNGGNTPASQRVEDGKKAQRPDDPEKAGFGFDNWYADSDLTTVYDFNTPVTGNITLYAKWVALISDITITVTGPLKGETPNAVAASSGSVNYTVGAVSWSPGDNPFKGSIVYTATVTLTAHTGSKFAETPDAKINGHTAVIIDRTDTTIILSHTFDATPEKEIKTIEIITQPERTTTYTHGDTLDLNGLSVKLTYDDGTYETFALADFGDIISTSPSDGSTLSHTAHDRKPVKVSVGSLHADTNNLTVKKATPTITFPTAGTITYGETLSQSALTGGSVTYGSFKWQNLDTVPTVNNTGYPVEFTPSDTDNYDYSSVSGWNSDTGKVVRTVAITVNKAEGGTVGKPAITGNAAELTITVIPAVTPPANGQSVEYARSTSTAAPESGWQDETTFGSLSLNTTYYIFARSKGDDNYNAGTASRSDSMAFYTVTFDSDGGTAVTSVNVISNSHVTRPADPTKSGYTFDDWYKESAYINKWSFTADAVTSSITLYAKWLPNTLVITLEAEQIINADPIIADLTLSRTGDGHSVTSTLSVNAGDYDPNSIRWEITGTGITETGASFTLNATDPRYNQIGEHHLTLIVYKDGVPYNKTIIFKIVG